MAQMGQKVTLSARSIIQTSGADLKPSVLELQAISVVLNLDDFPDSVPKPTRYGSTLFTFCKSIYVLLGLSVSRELRGVSQYHESYLFATEPRKYCETRL
jgi:hypothetical protein